mgnify:CR=1 FL=1
MLSLDFLRRIRRYPLKKWPLTTKVTTMDLTNKSELIHYLQSHGLYTQKKLGQNFLIDRVALEKIVEAADISKDDLIVEVGPGLGTLTEELIKNAGKVVAVELDKKLAVLLGERFATAVISSPEEGHLGRRGEPRNPSIEKGSLHGGRDDNMGKLEIINSDILKVNIDNITKGEKYKVVANIPYYITSKILRFFLEQENKPETIVLLTQKEVAERICAKPGEMSVLSVSVQAYGEPEIIDIVKRDSFFPAPEVDSAILRISNIHPFSCHSDRPKGVEESFIRSLDDARDDKKAGIQADNCTDFERQFFRCVHIGFASRRKTLLNNLSAGYHLDKDAVLDILKEAGLSDKARAQELSLMQWQKLSKIIAK